MVSSSKNNTTTKSKSTTAIVMLIETVGLNNENTQNASKEGCVSGSRPVSL